MRFSSRLRVQVYALLLFLSPLVAYPQVVPSADPEAPHPIDVPSAPEIAPDQAVPDAAADPRQRGQWIGSLPVIIQDEVRFIHDFFGTRLPGTLDQYNLSLEYDPKFGDFVNREYLRFPITLWYGLTDHTELLLGMAPFLPNPFRAGDDQRFGPGFVRTGARHRLHRPIFFFDQTTLGIDVIVPIGRPPESLTDYYGRLRPSISFSRQLHTIEHTQFLLSLQHDHAFDVPLRSESHRYIRRNTTDFSPGVLYKPDNVGYLAEYTLRLIDDDTGWRRGNIYTVGVLWDVPQRYVPQALPGDWRVDLAYRLTDEQERPLNHAVLTRVRVRFDFPQFMRQVRERPEHPGLAR